MHAIYTLSILFQPLEPFNYTYIRSLFGTIAIVFDLCRSNGKIWWVGENGTTNVSNGEGEKSKI